MRYVAAYFAAGIVMTLLDFLWLRVIASGLFRAQLGSLLAEDPNIAAAALFYIFFAAGLVFFAIAPGLRVSSLGMAMGSGAALGFVAYMTFELTCLAILKGWSLPVTLIDICWGTFLSAVSSAAGYAAVTLLFPRALSLPG